MRKTYPAGEVPELLIRVVTSALHNGLNQTCPVYVFSLFTSNNSKGFVRPHVTCLLHIGASRGKAGPDLGCERAYACLCDVLCHGGAILSHDLSPFHSVLEGILVHTASSEQERAGTMSKDSIKHSSSERTTLRWRDVPDDMVETHIKDLLYAERNIKTA